MQCNCLALNETSVGGKNNLRERALNGAPLRPPLLLVGLSSAQAQSPAWCLAELLQVCPCMVTYLAVIDLNPDTHKLQCTTAVIAQTLQGMTFQRTLSLKTCINWIPAQFFSSVIKKCYSLQFQPITFMFCFNILQRQGLIKVINLLQSHCEA